MKKNCIFIVLVLLIISVAFFACTTKNSKAVQTGDLLFVDLQLDYTFKDSVNGHPYTIHKIQNGEEVNYIHVAILEVDANDSLWIIDATLKNNVARYPFSTFLKNFTLKDGSYPRMELMRLKNNRHAADFVENAKKQIGKVYDVDMRENNGKLYCSELVRVSYVSHGDTIFGHDPIDFRAADGTIPTYWTEFFGMIGKPLPQGNRGILPNAMIKDKSLEKVAVVDDPTVLFNR